MNGYRRSAPVRIGTFAVLLLGLVGTVSGLLSRPFDFCRAWLCAFLFWLGLPLGALTLVLIHDLSGGGWMARARPALKAAIATMPVAVLAGLPAFLGLSHLYPWTHPASLGNSFYLNRPFFFSRYAIDAVLWNLLAGYALWIPRGAATPVVPRISWVSGVGLLILAFSASFAAIDWILSVQPMFWSSVFPLIAGAGWFNTGFAIVLLVVAARGANTPADVDHLADLAAILLSTSIFWAYVEFCQFLIVWEENLRSEIPWYLVRWVGVWRPLLLVVIGLGFILPFLLLLWRPCKRNAGVVAAVCISILLSRLIETWCFILPVFQRAAPSWLDLAAMLALGGLILLIFFNRLSSARRSVDERWLWKAHHG